MINIINSVRKIRGYRSTADRKRAIKMLRKDGFNHFVCFQHVKSQFALKFAKVNWIATNNIYVKIW